MFSVKRLMLIVVMLLIAGIWFMGRMVQAGEGSTADRVSVEVGSYSGRGSHFVGMRHLTINEQLAATIWYPASQIDSEQAAMSYPYELKLFASLSPIVLATSAGEAALDVPFAPTAEPYPLVVLSPGFAVGTQAYGWLAEHLASYGFVVIAPEHVETLDPTQLWRVTVTRPQDVQLVLDFVARQGAAGGLFEGMVDVDTAAVVGHSYGGYTALAAGGARLNTAGFQAICSTAAETDDPILFLCEALEPNVAAMATLAELDAVPEGLWPAWGDRRVQAVVSLAGDAAMFQEAGLAELTVPVMAMGGTADLDSPYQWSSGLAYAFAASQKKVEIGLVGGEHMIFTGRCDEMRRVIGFVPYGFCTDPAWDKDDAHGLVKHFTTAFLLAELMADGEAAVTLAPEQADFPNIRYQAAGYQE